MRAVLPVGGVSRPTHLLTRPFAFRLAARDFFNRWLTAFRAAADMRRLGQTAFRCLSRPEPFATMNEIGSSS